VLTSERLIGWSTGSWVVMHQGRGRTALTPHTLTRLTRSPLGLLIVMVALALLGACTDAPSGQPGARGSEGGVRQTPQSQSLPVQSGAAAGAQGSAGGR
jgi:hypothetical protein